MVDNLNPQQPPIPSNMDNSNVVQPQQSLQVKKSVQPILMYVGIAAFALLILGMTSYILFTKNATKKVASIPNNQQMYKPQNNILVPTTTPGITPITASNADQALSNTDATMQQSLNQMNTDFNDLNNVDATQDNPNNL